MNTTVKKLKVLKLIILTLVAAGILLALYRLRLRRLSRIQVNHGRILRRNGCKRRLSPKNRRAVQKYEGLPVREIGLLCVCELQKFKKRRTPSEQHPIYKHKSFLQLRIA